MFYKVIAALIEFGGDLWWNLYISDSLKIWIRGVTLEYRDYLYGLMYWQRMKKIMHCHK